MGGGALGGGGGVYRLGEVWFCLTEACGLVEGGWTFKELPGPGQDEIRAAERGTRGRSACKGRSSFLSEKSSQKKLDPS